MLYYASYYKQSLSRDQLISAVTDGNGKELDDIEETCSKFLGHALCIAASKGNVNCVDILMKKGANVNHYTPDGTPLILALKNDHEDCVRMLCSNQATMTYYDCAHPLPLMLTLFNLAKSRKKGHDNLKYIRILLECGASVNYEPLDMHCAQPMYFVIEMVDKSVNRTWDKEWETVVRLLLDYGAIIFPEFKTQRLKNLFEEYETSSLAPFLK